MNVVFLVLLITLPDGKGHLLEHRQMPDLKTCVQERKRVVAETWGTMVSDVLCEFITVQVPR